MHSYESGDRVAVRAAVGKVWGTVRSVDYILDLAFVVLDDGTVILVGPEEISR